jgi:hypothetical protein
VDLNAEWRAEQAEARREKKRKGKSAAADKKAKRQKK